MLPERGEVYRGVGGAFSDEMEREEILESKDFEESAERGRDGDDSLEKTVESGDILTQFAQDRRRRVGGLGTLVAAEDSLETGEVEGEVIAVLAEDEQDDEGRELVGELAATENGGGTWIVKGSLTTLVSCRLALMFCGVTHSQRRRIDRLKATHLDKIVHFVDRRALLCELPRNSGVSAL